MEITYAVCDMLQVLKNGNYYFMLPKHLFQRLKCTN